MKINKEIYYLYPSGKEMVEMMKEANLRNPDDISETISHIFYVLHTYYTFNKKKRKWEKKPNAYEEEMDSISD